jgi:hypothetical protein
MNLPNRPLSHIIETESINHIKSAFGSDWIFRNQEDRDYGIDIHLERFKGENPTGEVLYGQVKGTRSEFSDSVKLSGFPTKTICYARLFAIPFFLFYTSTGSKKTKFIWLQKYADLKIRSKILQTNDTVTIEFPEENILDENGIAKIVDILKREKCIKHGLTFITHYRRLINCIERLKNGEVSVMEQCKKQIAAIETSGVLKEYIDFGANDFPKFNARTAFDILNHIEEQNIIATDDRTELERVLFPLKIVETEFLNMDTNYAVCCWVNNTVPY